MVLAGRSDCRPGFPAHPRETIHAAAAAPASEVAADRLERDLAMVVGRGAQDHDLRRDPLQQPSEVLVAESFGPFVGGDDDAIEVLVLDQTAQRVARRAPTAD